jgi:hypothetical protein
MHADFDVWRLLAIYRSWPFLVTAGVSPAIRDSPDVTHQFCDLLTFSFRFLTFLGTLCL